MKGCKIWNSCSIEEGHMCPPELFFLALVDAVFQAAREVSPLLVLAALSVRREWTAAMNAPSHEEALNYVRGATAILIETLTLAGRGSEVRKIAAAHPEAVSVLSGGAIGPDDIPKPEPDLSLN